MSDTTTAPSPRPPALPPLEGMERIIGTAALSTAMLMNVLDMTIANVSIPAISGDLGVSPAQGTWIATSYGVANALSVILTGWLAQRLGQVRLMVGAILLFTVSSIFCALAPTLQLLVLFRIIQGLTAGPIIVLTQPLLLQSYPPEKISIALSAYIMTTMVGPIIGPVVGGALTDGLSWHWIFYINVPIGLVAAWFVWKIYHARDTTPHRVPIDFVALALLIACVGCMQLMIEQGRELDWFSSNIIVGLGLASLACGAYFVVWNANARHPVVDFSPFRQRNFVIGSTIMTVGFGLFMGSSIITSIWLQQTLGYTATWAGLTMIPASLVALLLTPVAGRAVQRTDLRWTASIALLALGGAFLVRSHLTSGADLSAVVLYQMALGFGMSMFFVPMMTMAMQGVAPEKMASAAGLMAFTRYVGGSSGTSLLITLWEGRSDHHTIRLYEQFTPSNPVFQEWSSRLNGLGLDSQSAIAFMQAKVRIEASTLGADDTFLFAAVLFTGMLVLLAASRRHKQKMAPVHLPME